MSACSCVKLTASLLFSFKKGHFVQQISQEPKRICFWREIGQLINLKNDSHVSKQHSITTLAFLEYICEIVVMAPTNKELKNQECCKKYRQKYLEELRKNINCERNLKEITVSSLNVTNTKSKRKIIAKGRQQKK